MGRLVRYNAPGRVDDLPVAPHRYKWTDTGDRPTTARECRQAAPYKEGEVVYVDLGPGRVLRARVYAVFLDTDRFGDWREAYRVQLETRHGTWSNQWVVVHPGHVQRGYKKMGLAPEMPS